MPLLILNAVEEKCFGSIWSSRISYPLLYTANHKQRINNKIIKKNKKQIKEGEITTKPSLRYLDLDDSTLVDYSGRLLQESNHQLIGQERAKLGGRYLGVSLRP